MSFQQDFPKPGVEYGLFENYSRILQDGNFAKAGFNTLRYSLATIFTIIPISLLFSWYLTKMNNRIRCFSLFCLLLPGLIPPSVMAILFNLTFNGKMGILNQVFVIPFGGKHINWMSDPHFILPSLVIQAVWRWTGFVTLFLLCGLEAVPKELKEAASIDGAGPVRTFFAVELPGIRHLILFSIAFLIIDTFSLFAGAYTLLGPSGGTANAGLVVVNYAYKFTRFQEFNMAATVCIMTLPFLMLLTGFFCLRKRRL